MAIPDAIAGAPQLREDLRWLWDAFSDLTTERAPGSMGGAPGHIPWRAMHDWCMAHHLRGDEETHFVACLKVMDDAYLEHVCKKLKEASDRHGNP